KDKFDVDLVVEENIHTEEQIIETVDELAEQGVNLIFGHGSIYGKTFTDISSTYADIQFVYFNGGYYADNVTSLTFNSHAMEIGRASCRERGHVVAIVMSDIH